MSRYIEADAFDERVRISVGLVEEELTDDYKDGVRCTLEMLKTQPTVDVPQWIPCSERLPEGDEIVLVNTLPIAPYQIILATAKDVRKYYTEGAVDAWMPLPEPWKEKQMTRKEAIKILSTRDNQGMPITWQNGFVEAYDLAIEALENEAMNICCADMRGCDD